MASAVAIEDLLACQADLDRAIQEQRGLRHDDLVVEWVALAAETAAVGCRDHAHMRDRDVERLRERAVHVVRRLRARPKHQLPVGIEGRQGSMLFERQVRTARVGEGIVEDEIGVGECLFDVAEAQRHALVDVSFVAVIVNSRRVGGQGLLDPGNGRERLVVHLDQVHGLGRRLFIDSHDGCYRVADEPHAVDGQGVLILADRQDPVRNRQIASGQNEMHARQLLCRAGIDGADAGVRDAGPEDLAVQHPGQGQVVGESCLSCHLGAGIHTPARASDDLAHAFSFTWENAASTASTICW